MSAPVVYTTPPRTAVPVIVELDGVTLKASPLKEATAHRLRAGLQGVGDVAEALAGTVRAVFAAENDARYVLDRLNDPVDSFDVSDLIEILGRLGAIWRAGTDPTA